MKLLAIDIGTGTQDIVLLDTSQPVENAVKLVLPSPTEMAARRIRHTTAEGEAVVLRGRLQGGGPVHWALEDHIRSGLAVFSTPEAARTFDDELDRVAAMGVTLVSEDESAGIAGREVRLGDLDLSLLRGLLASYEVAWDLDGIALGCLDHGEAPPGYSDRLFRFDHLRRILGQQRSLLAFAFRPQEVPAYLTRAHALLKAAGGEAPLAFMDTGPAAALGAVQDATPAEAGACMTMNLGNMHLLGFRLAGVEVEAMYEHHTGEVSPGEIEWMTREFVAGRLTHEWVYASKGHGATYFAAGAAPADVPLLVTGPQRGKLRETGLQRREVAPHGDMMVAGCFGLAAGFAAAYPETREEIAAALGLEWEWPSGSPAVERAANV